MASLAAAFAFWAWLDRGLWFFGDEWNFLVGRGLSYAPTNPQSIWYPHNEHWSTLPVLLWRGLYSVFHLGTYWPYIIPVLLAQVLVMHLAWRVSLRAGADIWVATAAVAVLGFLGAGAEDLAWGFQIGFVGSVLFGLLAFDLLDRRPRPGWPQLVLASVSLVASLMCSTIGDAMVVGAAVLAFARLPWRRALAVLTLPIFSYALWFSGVGRLGLSAHSDRFTLGTLTALPRYMWDGLSWALGRASNLQPAGVVILVVLIVWAVWNAPKMWRRQPVLLALCVATVAFYLLAGLGRDISTGTPDVSRYVYVAIALADACYSHAAERPEPASTCSMGSRGRISGRFGRQCRPGRDVGEIPSRPHFSTEDGRFGRWPARGQGRSGCDRRRCRAHQLFPQPVGCRPRPPAACPPPATGDADARGHGKWPRPPSRRRLERVQHRTLSLSSGSWPLRVLEVSARVSGPARRRLPAFFARRVWPPSSNMVAYGAWRGFRLGTGRDGPGAGRSDQLSGRGVGAPQRSVQFGSG